MNKDSFFPRHPGIRLDEVSRMFGAPLSGDVSNGEALVHSVAPVGRAQPGDICYILSRKNKHELATCKATAILCDPALAAIVPEGIAILQTTRAHQIFAEIGALLYPDAMRPVVLQASGISPQAVVDPSAHLEDNVTVDALAVIGRDVSIGSGTRIGAGVFIGNGVKIGRDCTIAAGASILCSYLGNGVIIHNGARIGQDGFGYAPGPRGMVKIVQIGRVIIQDNVEIGANTTIDRGTMDDTVIGEGTKIDNQVQIGHNVRIGRHCAIVSQVGIAGSTRLGDGVQIGGATGVNGHISIGDGVQVAAMSGVVADIPAGEKYGGIPARPLRDFLRDMAEIAIKAQNRNAKKGEGRHE